MTLFARLFLLIGLVTGVSLSLVALALWRGAAQLEGELTRENDVAGARVMQQGTRLLEENLRTTHRFIVREKARKVESYFVNIASSVNLQTELTRQFLTDDGDLNGAPPLIEGNELTRRAKADPTLQKSLVGTRPYSIYHLAPDVSERATADTRQRLRRLAGFFAHTQRTMPGCDSTYFGSEEGFIQGYPGGKSFFKPEYDPRKRPWYKSAMQSGEVAWLVNVDRNRTLILTCSRPLRLNDKQQSIGVSAVDVKLPNVLDEMFDFGDLRVSRAILVDDKGKVRFSEFYDRRKPVFDENEVSETPLVGQLSEPGFAQVDAMMRAQGQRTSGVFWGDSPIEEVQSVFIYSTVSFGGDNARDDWHYIVQLPVEALLAPIHGVTGEIDGATRKVSRAIQTRSRRSVAAVLGLTGVTLLIALSAAFFGARSTSRPLIQMANVTRRVGTGDLDGHAPEDSGGEIGELGRSINAMISGLRQRDLLKETFGKYVAPSVVDAVLRAGNVELGGVKREVSVFFSDLEGFTSLSETMPPETLVPLLNQYLDAMTRVVLDAEGTLDKYIGDAIVAFWGEPICHADDAARACQTALLQWRELDKLHAKWAREGRPALRMRIGIATGEAIVGNVGSQLKLNYTVMGDTVNLAARLESLNKFYGTRILIDETARRQAGAAIEARELDLLAVMGKTQAVRVYELLGETSNAQRDGYACYARALELYRAQKWSAAQTELDLAQQKLGGDKPSRILAERIERLRLENLPADWDGSFRLEQK